MSHDEVYFRFVSNAIDDSSGRRRGIFHTAFAFERSGRVDVDEYARFRHDLDWLCNHTRRPGRFSRSRNSRAANVALSWYRGQAKEHLARARSLMRFLIEQGELVHELRTKRPGYIVFEDDVQVVAEPFADTPT
jgi:hypothetical protein